MMRRPIGYYVHHHGAGHHARARAIAEAIDWPVVMIGTGIGDAGIDLPDDRPRSGHFNGRDGTPGRPDALHYAPLDHEGVRSRVARLTQWFANARPALMVVDVSVEVAMLARLASVPSIYVRLNGDRSDLPHLDAFRGASALLAPFHEDMEMPSTPDWVRSKTRYLPGITVAATSGAPDPHRILVVAGRGGPPVDGIQIARAARACPQMQWRVIGPATPPEDRPSNLAMAGWVDDAALEIAQAGVVIGGAGDGLVNAVIAADRPFVCLPETRPFGEQFATSQALERMGAAIVLQEWPSPTRWLALIEAARALPSLGRTGLHDPDGANVAAAWLAQQAQAISTAAMCPA
jgi:hypothetical protein